MTSALEALGAQRLRDSIARQGERLAGQARTGPAPGQVFGLSPDFQVTAPCEAGAGPATRAHFALSTRPDRGRNKKDPAPNKEVGSFLKLIKC